jgi:CRISPR-associated endonuclease/helicase Cas3
MKWPGTSDELTEVPDHCRPLWAKSGEDGSYHPLWCHLLDTAAVVRALWDSSFSEARRRAWQSALNVDEVAARAWLSFLAGLHDIGKASPGFQVKCPDLWENVKGAGFSPPSRRPERHDLVTEAVVSELLTQPLDGLVPWTKDAAQRIAASLAGHHGVFPKRRILPTPVHALGDGLWEAARADLVKLLAAATGVKGLPPPQGLCQGGLSVPCWIAGLVSVADWIASDTTQFPYCPDASSIPAYWDQAKKRADSAISRLGWRACIASEEQADFASLFGFKPKPMQQQVITLGGKLSGPTMVIIEAPMGEGKTEAAFFIADHFMSNGAADGTYVAMPTQATANAMFARFRSYLEQRYPRQAVNFHLIHGQAMLSEEYQQLQGMSQVWSEGEGGRSDTELGCIHAQEWFTHRNRGLLAPFAVGTIDQALLGALRTRHVSVRLFGLSNKCVILDEVHAYDTYTSTILERLLSWLSALGCSVVLLSATLPQSRRQALIKAYKGALAHEHVPPAAYPRVTVVRRHQPYTVSCPMTAQPPITLKRVGAAYESLAADIADALSGGGCAALICNTVRRAQETYKALSSLLRDRGIEVGLFHARFPFEERDALEKTAVRRLGKDRSSRPARYLFVATQVIEQSLDLDFDLMITELAPVDLVLQRAGRLHRHPGNPRPNRLQNRPLWLLDDGLDDDDWPRLDDGSRHVYLEYVLLRSWLCLHKCDRIRIPQDVEELIEAVYGEGEPEDALVTTSRFENARKEFKDYQEKLRRHAQDCFIPSPDSEKWLDKLTEASLETDDDPTTHPYLRALTRWSDEHSVSIACLFGTFDEAFLDAAHQEPIDMNAKPSTQLAKRILQREVRLTGHAIACYFQNAPKPKTWRASALLRHLVPAFFDGDGWLIGHEGWRLVEPFSLRLDPELGLVTTYPER